MTKDGLIIMASEAGIVDVDEDNIISNYHMKSEEIFGLSLEDGKVLENKYLKAREASKKKKREAYLQTFRSDSRLSSYLSLLLRFFCF